MTSRRAGWTGIGVILTTVGALLQTPAQPPPRAGGITALLPAGAALVLQAKDLASLVADWNGSAEKPAWLASANYEAFARSRVFLQLKGAYDASYAFRGKIDTDGFDHPRKIFDLTEELIQRNHTDADIGLILGGNFRRLLGVAWTRPDRPQQPGQGETRG